MTSTRKYGTAVFAAALTLMIIGFGAVAAEAKQTSLDSRIFQAFEKIDGRTNAHEQDVVKMRARIEQLSKDIGKLRDEMNNLPSDGDQDKLRKRRLAMHGRMINMSAEYLNQSYKLVDSAARVISENLTDLAALASELRKSGDPSGGAIKLKKRIQQNIAAGRSMRNALVQMRNWAKSDPGLVNRFQSLRRITMTLDRRIGIDKARLAGRRIDASGAVRNKRLEALDRTVDRLGDMYAQVTAEKEALKDLRDEVAMAVQLGRLEMTQEVAERAIPNFNSLHAASSRARPLSEMAGVINDLNNSLAVETSNTVVQGADGAAAAVQPGGLEIGGFSNF